MPLAYTSKNTNREKVEKRKISYKPCTSIITRHAFISCNTGNHQHTAGYVLKGSAFIAARLQHAPALVLRPRERGNGSGRGSEGWLFGDSEMRKNLPWRKCGVFATLPRVKRNRKKVFFRPRHLKHFGHKILVKNDFSIVH